MSSADRLTVNWLHGARARAYSIILLVGSLASMPIIFLQAMQPGGSDFIAFWSAAKLAARGSAALAYDPDALARVQHLWAIADVVPFVHPPQFFLAIAPLAALPYPVAWIAWVAVTYGVWVAVTVRLFPHRAWSVAAFSGALVSAWHAQTGFLTSALQSGVVRLLRDRPFAAGACVGLLVIKPHLALLFPVAFLASRNWSAIVGAVVSVIVVTALAWAIFGTSIFVHYPDSWAVSRTLFEQAGAEFYLRQVTVYATACLWFPAGVAAVVQGLATLAVALWTWRVWSRPGPVDGQLAFLLAATPLATPYLFSYDLPFLVIPVLWLADTMRFAWRKPVVIALYLAPLVCRAAALPLQVNVTPVACAIMAALVARQLGQVCNTYAPIQTLNGRAAPGAQDGHRETLN